jgi:hypothetical protein
MKIEIKTRVDWEYHYRAEKLAEFVNARLGNYKTKKSHIVRKAIEIGLLQLEHLYYEKAEKAERLQERTQALPLG